MHEIGQEQCDRTRNRCRPYAKSAPHRGRKENRMENTKMLTDEELAKELAKMTPAERAQAMAYVMGLVAGKAQARRGLHSRQMERAGDVERKDEL